MSMNDYDGSNPVADIAEEACFSTAAQNGFTFEQVEMCDEEAPLGCVNCPWRNPRIEPYQGDVFEIDGEKITVWEFYQNKRGVGSTSVIWRDSNGKCSSQGLASFKRFVKKAKVINKGEKKFPFPFPPEDVDESDAP